MVAVWIANLAVVYRFYGAVLLAWWVVNAPFIVGDDNIKKTRSLA